MALEARSGSEVQPSYKQVSIIYLAVLQQSMEWLAFVDLFIE
jgi:hypothetical protein